MANFADKYSGKFFDAGGTYYNARSREFDLNYDGATDDSTKILQIVQRINSSNGEGTILFPPGTVLISGNTTFSTGVALLAQSGCTFSVSSGSTFTVQGAFLTDDGEPHFSGNGGVKFGPRAVRFVDPRWFGADFDGSTGDDSAWSAAIAALPSTGSRVLIHPGGNSKITTPIVLSGESDLVFQGVGHESVITASTDFSLIKSTQASSAPIENLLIRGMRLVGIGGPGNAHGIQLSEADNSEIEDVHIEEMPNRGISANDCERLRVRFCHLVNIGTGTTSAGEGIYAGKCDFARIVGNEVVDGGRHSINIFRSRNAIVGWNVLNNSGRASITISGGTTALGFNGKFASLIGNTIKSAGRTGILVENEADYTVVIGNTIEAPADFGVLISDGDDGDGPTGCSVIGNTIQGVTTGPNGGSGVRVSNSPRTVVSGNTIDGPADHGVRVNSSNSIGSVVSDNAIRDAGLFGVELFNTHFVNVMGNSVESPARHGIDLDASTRCSVSFNAIVNANGTQSTSVNYNGIHLKNNARQNKIDHNTVVDIRSTKFTVYGVFLESGSSGNWVRDNDATDVKEVPVRAAESNNYVENAGPGVTQSTLSGNITVNISKGPYLRYDSGGSPRNITPAGLWPIGYEMRIENISTTGNALTWDPTGLNESVAQGNVAVVMYNGSEWKLVSKN